MKKNLKILGVCQGQGALLFPVKKYLVGNIEPRSVFHSPKEPQWRINFGNIPFVRTIEEFDRVYSGKIDIILSSCNCGASSILSYSRKKTLGKPKEDYTINLFIESISKYKPKIFLLENLPRLMDFISLKDWEKMLPNYDFIVHCHSVSEFGNSQISRKRLVLIGIDRRFSRKYSKYFDKVFMVDTIKTTGELLDISTSYPIANYKEPLCKKVPMYDYRDPNKENLNLQRIQELWVGDFKDHYKWPIFSKKMRNLPGVYRNHPNKYPMTVRPSSRQFNPDGSIMGIRDYLVIQGFPKKYKIYIDDNNLQYWVNKARIAITKGPSYQIGIWFKRCLKKCIR